ncbi:hypothetical protein HY373_02280 [Candidatus Berkelbacteria bacterium]|nr:hypothetical protein [Candidatus Berkelbacteria bacterium]
MTWRGDKTLPWTFTLFLMLLALFLGETLPNVISGIGGVLGTYGAKDPIIKSVSDFNLLLVIYGVYGLFFWLCYRYINWKIVWILALIIAFVLEQYVFTHPPGSNDLGNSLLDFTGKLIIVYSVILLAPYGLFQIMRRKWGTRAIAIVIVGFVLLNVIGNFYTYYKLKQLGLWPWHPVTSPNQSDNQSSSSQGAPILPANTCPDKLVEKKDQPTIAHLNNVEMLVTPKIDNWVRENCPGALQRIEKS